MQDLRKISWGLASAALLAFDGIVLVKLGLTGRGLSPLVRQPPGLDGPSFGSETGTPQPTRAWAGPPHT